MFSVDGSNFSKPAEIGPVIGGRLSGGPVYISWSSVNAQATPAGQLVVHTTGKSTTPAGDFSSAFILSPMAGGGFYVRAELLRFSAGTAAFNATLDGSGSGMEFAKTYYETYARNRMELAPYYREASKALYEGISGEGLAGIGAALEKAPVGSHAIETCDVVPIGAEYLFIMVTGKITLEGQENPLAFSHSLLLTFDATGLYIANEIFKFVYG